MTRWTQEDVDRLNAQRGETLPAHLPPAKASKYRNVRVVVDGEKFDSKREAKYWAELRVRESVGEIVGLMRQVRYPLYCPIVIAGVSLSSAAVVSEYVADFVYTDNRTLEGHVVDAKGKRTRMYALKKKWLELQNGITIEEV